MLSAALVMTVERYGAYEANAAASVFLTTVLSLIAFPLVMALA